MKEELANLKKMSGSRPTVSGSHENNDSPSSSNLTGPICRSSGGFSDLSFLNESPLVANGAMEVQEQGTAALPGKSAMKFAGGPATAVEKASFAA